MKNLIQKISHLLMVLTFFVSSVSISNLQAGEIIVPIMPKPGTMVNLSPVYKPAFLNGIVIHPDNALQFDFLIHKGEGNLDEAQKNEEYTKLVKYFLASLTVPDSDQWVNLSPYENDRIIKDNFGKTEMGRDLLSQDYLLKQITSSLMYPESGLGKNFWNQVYERAYQEFGNAQVPVNTFNKVWIVPDEALVYESGNTAYVVKSHLKVMLEEDYLSLDKHSAVSEVPNKAHAISSKMIKQIILPALEKEVNEGKNFAQLRQIYSGMVLATWYKAALKESLLGKVYADKAKVVGVDLLSSSSASIGDPEKIYQQYLTAFKKGVYNYIKEDVDRYTKQIIPRKYFSGGFQPRPGSVKTQNVSQAMIVQAAAPNALQTDLAMINLNPASLLAFNNLISFIQEPSKRGKGESGPSLSIEQLDIIKRDLMPNFSDSQKQELSKTITLSYPEGEAERISKRLELPIDLAMATPTNKGDVSINRNGRVEVTKPFIFEELSPKAQEFYSVINVKAKEIKQAILPSNPQQIQSDPKFVASLLALENKTRQDPGAKQAIALYQQIQALAKKDLEVLSPFALKLLNDPTLSKEDKEVLLSVMKGLGFNAAMISQLLKFFKRKNNQGEYEKGLESFLPIVDSGTDKFEKLASQLYAEDIPETKSTSAKTTIFNPTARPDSKSFLATEEMEIDGGLRDRIISEYVIPHPNWVISYLDRPVSLNGSDEIVRIVAVKYVNANVGAKRKSGYNYTIRTKQGEKTFFVDGQTPETTINSIRIRNVPVSKKILLGVKLNEGSIRNTVFDPNNPNGVWLDSSDKEYVTIKPDENINVALASVSTELYSVMVPILKQIESVDVWKEQEGPMNFFTASVKAMPIVNSKNRPSINASTVEERDRIYNPQLDGQKPLKSTTQVVEPLLGEFHFLVEGEIFSINFKDGHREEQVYSGQNVEGLVFEVARGVETTHSFRFIDNVKDLKGNQVWPIKSLASKAMAVDRKGGIDLNAANLNFQIKRDGQGVPLPISEQDMNMLQQIQGFIPSIIEIRPVTTMPMFSHLDEAKPQNYASAS